MRMNFMKKSQKTKKTENVGYIELKNSVQSNGVEMYIYGDIVSSGWDKWSEEDKCPQDIADFMAKIPNEAEMTIYFNSGGGDVFAGIGICNILKRHAGHKKGIVDGLAASIASVILMACDEIIVASGAQIMIHKPLTIGWGNADDFTKLIEQLDKCQESITDIYMEKVKEGISRDIITEKINEESWMSGEDAAEIFDITVEKKPAIAACTSYMMNLYTNVPKDIYIESVEDAGIREETAIIQELDFYGI